MTRMTVTLEGPIAMGAIVTSDLRVVRYMADRIGVLYRGRLVETGSSDQIFAGPNHPYTRMLLEAASNEAAAAPPASAWTASAASPTGCAFAARCPLAGAECLEAEPPSRETAPGHLIACWRQGG